MGEAVIAYLWVAMGGALGSMARYGISIAAARMWGSAFPWGTLIVNVLCSFIIGLFGTLTVSGGVLPASPGLRTFVMVGFCGGFTTFSSFSLQTLELARGREGLSALANMVGSVVLCLVVVAAGYYVGSQISAAARRPELDQRS